MKTIQDLAGSKLHPDEEQIVREAADALLFCDDLGADPAAGEALRAARGLADRLLESDRITAETSGRLIADVEACGPLVPVS